MTDKEQALGKEMQKSSEKHIMSDKSSIENTHILKVKRVML